MTLWHLLAEVALTDLRAVGYQCEAHRGGDRCDEIAAATAHWPSGDSRQCAHHIAWMREVAAAMGFVLHTTPLPVKTFEPAEDPSAQRFALMELDR